MSKSALYGRMLDGLKLMLVWADEVQKESPSPYPLPAEIEELHATVAEAEAASDE